MVKDIENYKAANIFDNIEQSTAASINMFLLLSNTLTECEAISFC